MNWLKIERQVHHSFVVRSLINSEGGNLRFATKYPDNCGDCEIGDEALGPFSPCTTCGRASNDGGRVISGDGDGIYPVVEVIDPSDAQSTPVAVLVVFDSNYDLANRLTKEAALGQRPLFSHSDLMNFLQLATADVTSLAPSATILLGGGSPHEPAIDCAINPALPAIARVYVEKVGGYTGNFGSFNVGNETKVNLPRLLAIGPEHVLNAILGTPTSKVEIDWKQEAFQSMASIVTSHKVAVTDDLCRVNAQIADSYLKDISQVEHGIRNWDDHFFSWVLLGSQLNEPWCTEMIKTTFGVPDSAKQSSLISRRVFGLPQSTVEVDDANMEALPTYCSQCGGKFIDLTSKFCSNCGHRRPIPQF